MASTETDARTYTFKCGCVHTFAGVLGALTQRVPCATHAAPVRPLNFSRPAMADEAELAEIARLMRLSA